MIYERLTGERLGKRNLHYNIRHRQYGKPLTAMDIDFVEYDKKTGEPLAFFETKYGKISKIDLNDGNLYLYLKLAQPFHAPVFCLVYYPFDKNGNMLEAETPPDDLAHIQFYIIGINEEARKWLKCQERKMTEVELVQLISDLHCEDYRPDVVPCSALWDIAAPKVIGRTKYNLSGITATL